MIKHTIFNTPAITACARTVARIGLWVTGWKAVGQPPQEAQFVAVGAPHTSNWDFLLVLVLAFVFKVKPRVLAKNSLFRKPWGPLFRWLACLPVDRSSPHGLVGQVVRAFEENDDLVLGIAPEGTRSRTRKWRTGFYYIAEGAKVPIAVVFLDYKNKRIGIAFSLTPSGDVDADMERICSFYKGIEGKHPEHSVWAGDEPDEQ